MPTQRTKTLIIGASPKPDRYAYRAAIRLLKQGHSIAMLGLRAGQIQEQPIQTGFPTLNDIDTVTLYIGPHHQAAYLNYLIQLRPRRVIFNPGTENPMLERQLQDAGIEPIEACTLVMLSTGTY